MPGAAAKQGHTHPHIQPDRQTTQTDNHNHSHPPHSPSVKPGGSLVRSVLVPSTKGALAMVKAPRCSPLKPSTPSSSYSTSHDKVAATVKKTFFLSWTNSTSKVAQVVK